VKSNIGAKDSLRVAGSFVGIAATAGALVMACSVGDGRVAAVVVADDAGDSAASDAATFDAAGCFDVSSLCKANNVACGEVLVHDDGCDRDRVVACGTCPGAYAAGELIGILGSEFRMGNGLPSSPAADEKPQHLETVASFLIDRTEVTVAAYTACVAAKACTPAGTGGACNYGVRERAQHPINCVDWYQANALCSFRGDRLPTEAEWEFVSRGGVALRTYPWGNQSPAGLKSDAGLPVCWSAALDAGVRASTCPVDRGGNADTTSQGIVDLAANVREWTVDGWSPNYASPRRSAFRVQRGGGWFADVTPDSVNAIHRIAEVASARAADVGFRCVRPASIDAGVPTSPDASR